MEHDSFVVIVPVVQVDFHVSFVRGVCSKTECNR